MAWAEDNQPSIIYMIGDGMGPAYTSAYRYYQDDPQTKKVEATIFDHLFVGMASTYPDDKAGVVTDSAAAATALATGVKTYDGAIAVDRGKRPVKTVLEMAREQGYQTAMVVTSPINHATPAAFAAHVDSRKKYTEIANQYIDLRINDKPLVDLLIGGGRSYFDREDRNIMAEFEAQGYKLATSFNDLEKIQTLPAIALLADGGLPWALDSEDNTRLAAMTKKALSLMGKKPFFMMIEGSQIDWCGHINDIACAMAEMHDFAETVKLVKQYIDDNPNTVLVITADHSTGGLSMGVNKEYLWRPSVIKKVKASAQKITKNLVEAGDQWAPEWEALTGISLSTEEKEKFQKTIDQLMGSPKDKNDVPGKIFGLVAKTISAHSRTGWTTAGHTGVDVQIFSYGKYAKAFSGMMDNTDIAKKIIEYLYKKEQ